MDQHEFQTSLDYIVRIYFKITTKKEKYCLQIIKCPNLFFELHSELILSQIGNDCVSLYSRSLDSRNILK